MIKFLLVGASFSNKGAEAMIITTCEGLKKYFPDSRLILTSPEYKYDKKKIEKLLLPLEIVSVINQSASKNKFIRIFKFGYRFLITLKNIVIIKLSKEYEGRQFINNKFNAIYHSDIIIDISGIDFTDYFSNSNTLSHMLYFLYAKILNKPYFCFPQAFGPANKFINKFAIKLCMSMANYIMPRGNISKRFIEELGITKNVKLITDLAFSFDKCNDKSVYDIFKEEKIDYENKKFVGITINTHLYNWSETDIIQIFAKFLDYITEKCDYEVLLLIHALYASGIDDSDIAEMIYEKSTNKPKIHIITGDYSASELKGIISKCHILMGSRFHSMIAALSTNVPVLVIGWGHKYKEILDLFEMNEVIVDYKELSSEKLIEKFEEVNQNYFKLKDKISCIANNYKNTKYEAAEIVFNEVNKLE